MNNINIDDINLFNVTYVVVQNCFFIEEKMSDNSIKITSNSNFYGDSILKIFRCIIIEGWKLLSFQNPIEFRQDKPIVNVYIY